MTDHANMLRQAAAEMRHYGHDGWPNVCDWGADELDRLNAQALELCAEISKLRREREDFHMDYRMKCDTQTKRLHVDNERLRVLLRDVIADDEASLARGDYGIANGLRLSIDAALAGTADQPSAALTRDAARYRWLRVRASQSVAYDRYGDGCHWSIGFFSEDSRKGFDAAVDENIPTDPTLPIP